MPETAVKTHEDLSRIDVARMRIRLLALREELEARRGDRDLLQLKQVDSALRKMTRGGYGICESCTRPVHKARLLEAPQIRYCAICSGAGPRAPSRTRA